MNYQDIFNKVSTHLLEQNEKAVTVCSVSGETSCRYKTPEGLKCAVGALIPEGHSAEDAQMNVDDLLVNYPDLATLFGVSNDDPDETYEIHDNNGSWHWNECLEDFAIKHELSSKVCNG
jgi:hypothetical protein